MRRGGECVESTDPAGARSAELQKNIFGPILGALGLPAHAAGTLSRASGLALVGENGPELVNLPGGSQVIFEPSPLAEHDDGLAPLGAGDGPVRQSRGHHLGDRAAKQTMAYADAAATKARHDRRVRPPRSTTPVDSRPRIDGRRLGAMSVAFPVVRGATLTPKLVRTGGDLNVLARRPDPAHHPRRHALRRPGATADARRRLRRARGCPPRLCAEAIGITLLLTMPQMIERRHRPRRGDRQRRCLGTNVLAVAPPPPIGVWPFLHLRRPELPALRHRPPERRTPSAVSPLLRVIHPGEPPISNWPSRKGSKVSHDQDMSWSLDYFRFVGHAFTITENA